EAPAADVTAADAQVEEATAEAPVAEGGEQAPVASDDAATADATSSEAVAEAAPAEPEMVEVWRPGGRSEERRGPRQDRNRRPDNRAAQPEGATEGDANG